MVKSRFQENSINLMNNHRPRLTDMARIILALDTAKVQYYTARVSGIDNETHKKIKTVVVQGMVFNEADGKYLFTLAESLAPPTGTTPYPAMGPTEVRSN